MSNTITELPENWATLTPAQRHAWTQEQIEGIALDILRDFGAAYGRVAISTQKELYLAAIRPAIEESLKGIDR